MTQSTGSSDETTDEERWIPVKERLPEKLEHAPYSDDCLVSVRGLTRTISAFLVDGAWFHADNEEEITRTVTAWRPFPKPYDPTKGATLDIECANTAFASAQEKRDAAAFRYLRPRVGTIRVGNWDTNESTNWKCFHPFELDTADKISTGEVQR